MDFILFMDEVGAEFTKARATRKDVRASYDWKQIRLVPVAIRPLEVQDEGGAAKRAAGGFLLLGPAGAAAGVLLGRGPKVLFELEMADGSVRRGAIRRLLYPSLRKKVEAIQRYRPGQLRKQLAWSALAVVILLACLAMGPVGIVLLTLLGVGYLVRRYRRKPELAA